MASALWYLAAPRLVHPDFSPDQQTRMKFFRETPLVSGDQSEESVGT